MPNNNNNGPMNWQEYCAAQHQEWVNLLHEQARLRKDEKSLRARESALLSEFQTRGGSALRSHLEQFIPPEFMPGNVGDTNAVAWPFYYTLDFDFGVAPALTSATRQVASFQVTQEAGLLLMGISRDEAERNDTAGALGPWQIEFRDRQSSRQFNDRSVPLQSIGFNSRPTTLPTPMLLLPNANFDVIMDTFLPAGITQNTAGDARQQIIMTGLRVRVDDAQSVLSTMYGG